MKRFAIAALALFLASGTVLLTPAPAQARTSFTMSVSDGDYRHDRHDPHYRVFDRHDRWRHHHRAAHWRHHPVWHPPIVRNVYTTYVPAPTRVVYQTPVRYVPAAIMADQASPTFVNAGGQLCREYQSSAWIGGSLEDTYGTACLQGDGAWRVVD